MLNNFDQRGITNYDTLQATFDYLRQNKMCMSKEGKDNLSIWWNPDYLAELKDDIETSVGGRC